jgi:hypothetical protein
MAQEDEMSLPYLVFRAWREYYDSLCLVEKLLTNKEYNQAREQMEQAEAFLGKAKAHLLQRGMSPDDACIRDIAAACLEHQAQISVDQVKAMLEQAGLRKAQVAELLWLGAAAVPPSDHPRTRRTPKGAVGYRWPPQERQRCWEQRQSKLPQRRSSGAIAKGLQPKPP